MIDKLTRHVAVAVTGMLIGGATAAHAQDIFLSEVDSVGGGVAVGTPDLTFMPGDGPQSLYVWMSDDFKINQSIGFNVEASNSGVVALTAAEVYNSTIESQALDGLTEPRWQGTGGGTVSPDSILNFNAVSVTEGMGLDSANDGTVGPLEYLDEDYDVDAGMFLIGRIDFDVVSVGETVLSLDVGQADIVADGSSFASEYSYGGAQIAVVPEPGSMALLAVGGALLLRRRR